MTLRIQIRRRYERWSVVRAKVASPARDQLHQACGVCLRGCDFLGAKDLSMVLLGFDEDDALAWSALGHAFVGLEDFGLAEDAFDAALRLRQADAPAALALAQLLAARGESERALLVLEPFDGLRPSRGPSAEAQARSAPAAGHVGQNIETLRERLSSSDDGDIAKGTP